MPTTTILVRERNGCDTICDLITCCYCMMCPPKEKQITEDGTRVCPLCRNVSVTAWETSRWCTICEIPAIQVSAKYTWKCVVCDWEMEQDQGFEPSYPAPSGNQQWSGNYQLPGYAPPYQYQPQPQMTYWQTQPRVNVYSN